MNEPPTDALLLERVRNSDAEAFRVLFERYQPTLFRQVLFQTRNAGLAHDTVQETFIRVWEHRRRLDPGLSFPAYLMRISGNLVLDEYRRRKRHEELDAQISVTGNPGGDDPLEELESTMLEEEISAVIVRLPERCRAVFLLSRLEGKSNREIAAVLGISVRTVEHQINHALNAIRKRVRDHLHEP